jgi:hypothetical protein
MSIMLTISGPSTVSEVRQFFSRSEEEYAVIVAMDAYKMAQHHYRYWNSLLWQEYFAQGVAINQDFNP